MISEFYKITLLIIILTPGYIFACSCPPGPTWNESYTNSEHIIIGKAIDDNIIKVIEVFKGNHIINDIINMELTSNCESTIYKNKTALLFLKENNQLGCYPNQTIRYMNNVWQEPFYQNQSLQPSINKIYNDLKLQNYLTWLRTKKQNIENTKLKSTVDQLTTKIEEINRNSSDDRLILYILIIMNAVMIFLVLLFKITR